MSAGSVLPAVQKAAESALKNLAQLAVADAKSPLKGLKPDDIVAIGNGRLAAKNNSTKSDSFIALLGRAGRAAVEATEHVDPNHPGEVPPDAKNPTQPPKLAFFSFGAYFAEVRVHRLTCEARVSRVVTAMNIGQPLNAKTARSQVLGGAIFSIGAALTEHSIFDGQAARWITHDLGTYHVPVNADTPDIDVHFVGPPDYQFNPQGARGIGEIGNTGLAAAIGNAIYHATGARIRSLPITPDKILTATLHEGAARNS
jgi:xanthine dehydrogenase YagR molybdenum-binding subunit